MKQKEIDDLLKQKLKEQAEFEKAKKERDQIEEARIQKIKKEAALKQE